MARFRGVIAGNRGAASRLGTKKSGLVVRGNGWHIGGRVELGVDEEGRDYVTVSITGGSIGADCSCYLGTWYRNDKGELVRQPYA